MGLNCKMCSAGIADSPDMLVLCAHHAGPVHLGCCIDNCSMDKKPCEHALSVYERI